MTINSIETIVIADRLYNVEQIAQATMGVNSIVDDAQDSSDLARNLKLIISPPSSNV